MPQRPQPVFIVKNQLNKYIQCTAATRHRGRPDNMGQVLMINGVPVLRTCSLVTSLQAAMIFAFWVMCCNYRDPLLTPFLQIMGGGSLNHDDRRTFAGWRKKLYRGPARLWLQRAPMSVERKKKKA